MWEEISGLEREFRDLRLHLAAEAVLRRAEIVRRLLALEARYRPDQPRVPAGSSEGGRWTSDGGGRGDAGVRVAQGPRRPRSMSDSPALGAREQSLIVSQGRARELLARIKDVDPTWQPPAGVGPPGIDGALSRSEQVVRAAEARLGELGRLPPDHLISAYRANGTGVDLLGRRPWAPDEGTVAVTTLGGEPVFGVNSRSPAYTAADERAAHLARDILIRGHPKVMATENVGRIPNDALYHAESTLLLRAARLDGGTLAGRVLEVTVDRPLCASCNRVLPYLGLHLGNPTATFVGPGGVRQTIRDGRWE